MRSLYTGFIPVIVSVKTVLAMKYLILIAKTADAPLIDCMKRLLKLRLISAYVRHFIVNAVRMRHLSG
jgi:hypothetical protein